MDLSVLTDDGAALLVRALLEGLPAAETLTHLAVGTGTVLDGQGQLTSPSPSAHGLTEEIGRARYLSRAFVVEDAGGSIVLGSKAYRVVDEPTMLLYLRFRFLDDEAVGDWTEFALCAGGVTFVVRGAALLDGQQAGDDRANTDVVLGGSYTGAENQSLTVTVSDGGGSGVATIGWVSTGDAPPSGDAVVFGTPITLPETGLTLTFSGGTDELLTAGDQWEIRATRAPQSPTFATGGVYDPVANEAGQVATPGIALRLIHRDPPIPKPAAILDVQLVTRVLNP